VLLNFFFLLLLIMNSVSKNMTQVISFARISLIIALMSSALLSNAQKGLLHGRVVDAEGLSIPGAIITAAKVDTLAESIALLNGTVCDSDGNYSIALDEGKYSVEAKYAGFNTSQIVLKINAAGDIVWNFVLEPAEEVLGIVVISAGKFEQDLGEVTVSMEVIKPKLIQDKNSNSIDEILQQTPGVAIVDDEPQIRSGSGYSFGAGSRVQILMDDIPMISGDAGKPTWDFLPIENLSQVEVIKGASSVLYGSSALSGAINMRTAFPGDKPETQVTVFHGLFSTPKTSEAKYWSGMPMKTGGSFLHKRKIGNLDFVIGGYFLGSDGHLGPQRDSTAGAFTNGYNPFSADRYEAETRGRMNVNLRYKSKKITGLSYGVNTNWSLSNSLSTLIWENNTSGLYGAYQGSATRTEQTLGTVDPFIVYTPRNGEKHSLRGRWQTLDNKNDNNQGNFSDVFYAEYQYQKVWNTKRIHDLTTNVGAVSTNTFSRGQLYIGGNEDGKNTALNQAAYFQIDKKWGKLNASGGVRYEMFDINGSKESKPVFRAGLNYKLAKATYIRASYGQGYRFPSIAEKFIVTALGAVKIYANPDLKSETSYNAEVGIKQGFKIGNFKGYADIAVFQQEFKNYIEFTFGQWASVPTIENLFGFGFKSINTGNSRVRGAEFSVMGEGKIGPVKLELLGGYTYTLPESLTPDLVYARRNDLNSTEVTYANTSSDPTNNILKYRLQHLVRFDLQGTWRAFSLGGSFRYNSHMQNIDNAFEFLETTVPMFFNPGIVQWREQHTSGDFIIDSRVAWKINEHHKIAFVVNNLLNREYAIRPLSIEEPRVSTVQYIFNF
jgi:iron complex outermembrane receptor protein